MEVLFYRDPNGKLNFGDDLNEVIWRELLPKHLFKDDDIRLLGIGSIFNADFAPLSHTRGKRMFVIGSGAGYFALPPGWENWKILAVRGPLTAELVGKPEVAATDSAALLSVLPQVVRLAPERNATLLIPHHSSAAYGQWEKVAAAAGMTLLDPRWPVPIVMEHFSRAKLVVTEAMHGAIVADTLRIPWIPITIAPDTLPFKWRDWTLSLDLPYEPVLVPASAGWEMLHHRALRRWAKRDGLVASALVKDMNSKAGLIADFKDRYKTVSQETSAEKAVPNSPAKKRILSITRTASSPLDDFFISNAAKQVRKIALGKSYLSKDSEFSRAVNQLQEAVNKFVNMVS
jgi:succinoglycan biosynthesis protein ExoV